MKIHQLLIASLLLVAATLGLAQTTTPPRFSVVNNGQEVVDNKTGLTWRRCAEGMVVSTDLSNCQGTATVALHEDALNIARTANVAAVGWRLPNVKELNSILNRDLQGATIDAVAFPSTLQGTFDYFWSSTPDTTAIRALTISFNSDKIGVHSLIRRNDNSGAVFTGYVRLVRFTAPP
jgi:hypothetical protein